MQNMDAYSEAKKKVKKIKGFYQHLVVYLVINAVILGIKGWFLGIFSGGEPRFSAWEYWNILSTPLIWGAVLLIHGLYIYSLQSNGLIGKWEERKIREIMEADITESRKTIEKYK